MRNYDRLLTAAAFLLLGVLLGLEAARVLP